MRQLFGLFLFGFSLAAPSSYSEPFLSLQIRCDMEAPIIGGEIPITFVLTNDGSESYRYTTTPHELGRTLGFSLQVSDSTGEMLEDPRKDYGSLPWDGWVDMKVLFPETSAEIVVPLNHWALIDAPGTYDVRGVYQNKYYSPSISIPIAPRREGEMAAYVQGLQELLKASVDDEERALYTRKLMFTRDLAALPVLLERLQHPEFSARIARWGVCKYMPLGEEVDQKIIQEFDDTPWKFEDLLTILERRQAKQETVVPLLREALRNESEFLSGTAIYTTRSYFVPEFLPRLIALAGHEDFSIRSRVAWALAPHHTPEVERALQSLLQDQEEQNGKTISQITENALQNAEWKAEEILRLKEAGTAEAAQANTLAAPVEHLESSPTTP